MEMLRRTTIAVAALAALTMAAGCQKGPMQETGERVDRALGQDPVIGKGPVERAGKDVDKAVDNLKK
jgi:hypothetical protein